MLLGLWHRAVGLLIREGGNLCKIKRHLSTRCKPIEHWPGIIVLFTEVGTCLSTKLVTCIPTVRYLQGVSFILFNTDIFLAACTENRLSLLCNLWWVGMGISSALFSACIRPPLQ